jgi:cytochrome c oxidase cbb3-type subunit 3/ubiquinol-cytochrome c reductase cytochrome c subunit
MLRPIVLALLVVLATVASGSIECTPANEAYAQHRGAEMYGRMCVVCHGMNGEGYKADQAPAIGHSDYLAAASDDYLFRTINDGRAATTMSAWGFDHGGPLKRHDVEATIAYMRTWQKDAALQLDERPATGQVQRGAPIYARECATCHGTQGTGGKYVGIGGSQLLANATNGFLRNAILRGRPGTAMPAFENRLDDVGVEDLIALLREWQKMGPPATAQRAAPARPPPIPLGPVPLNPKGPEPEGFNKQPLTTKADVIHKELARGARMALLDARAPSDYTNEHIVGAVSVPFYDPDQYFAGLPKDAWLVCYCACPHAESGQLAAKLVAHGFTKVTVLDEGLGYWRGHAYGTHNGIDP